MTSHLERAEYCRLSDLYPPRGRDPTGRLSYEASGRMAVQLGRRDRRRPSRRDWTALEPDEYPQVVRTETPEVRETCRPMFDLTPKPAEASRTTLAALTMPEDTNFYGTIHGRILIRLADECGALAAMRYVGSKMINTAALDALMILSPVRIGERVEAHAEVSYVGRTSVETRIEVYAEPFSRAEPRLVAVGYALYVALDETGNPQPVPPLPRLTEADHRRDQDGQARQAARLARRRELIEGVR